MFSQSGLWNGFGTLSILGVALGVYAVLVIVF